MLVRRLYVDERGLSRLTSGADRRPLRLARPPWGVWWSARSEEARTERTEEAIEVYARLTALQPDVAGHWVRLARLLDRAVEADRRARAALTAYFVHSGGAQPGSACGMALRNA
jgi:hypothetical protein